MLGQEEYVRDIVLLDQPIGDKNMPTKLNDMKVRVYNQYGKPVVGKLVSMSILDKRAAPSNYIAGELERITDENGYAIFSNIEILKTGKYIFCFSADGVNTKSRPLEILPKGLSTNFENEEFGSEPYMEALMLKIALNKGQDRVTINGEEID